MFAVIKTGGKQYRVSEDQVIRVDRIEAEPGTIVQIGNVLMLGGDQPQLGLPMVSGASVAAEIVEQSRGAKVIAFKKRRRKNSRRKRGHRQDYTVIRITEILTDGKAPTKTARPKAEKKPKPADADTADTGAETKPTGKAGKQAVSAKKAKEKKAKAAAKPAAKTKKPAKPKALPRARRKSNEKK